VADRLASVRRAIDDACERIGRSPGGVLLIGAAKTVSIGRIAEAVAAGLADVGENRAAELAAKAPRLDPSITWHFLGKLQRGTVARVAQHADVVHSVEPGRATERLASRLEREGRVIPTLIEVDFTGHRQGVDPEHVLAFAEQLAGFRSLDVRGLMTVPPLLEHPDASRRYFARLRELGERLTAVHPDAVELSMGMSADYVIAVEEGATMVRVGTAIFGPRPEPAAHT
jgi:pyridoxal phosphate enzyme (YggS family)